VKYRLLNIFYNRGAEIQVLESIAEEEQLMKEKDEEWLMRKKKAFKTFLYNQKMERRRENKNFQQRPYSEALGIFNTLLEEIDSFDKPVQKRLRKIEKNWEHFTAFYFVKDAPATNNPRKTTTQPV